MSADATASAAPEMADGTKAKQRRLRPVSNSWSWLKYSQLAYIGIEALSAAGAVATLSFFDRMLKGGFSTDAEMMGVANFVDGANALIGFAFFAIFAVSVVSYARFFHRSMNNVQAAGDPDATMPPGWTWGYHFIPILNLWKPLQGVLQIWRASMRLTAENPKVPATVGWWWAAWLSTNVISNISLRLSISSGVFDEEITDFDMFLSSFYFDIASSVTGIICSVLLLRLASRIHRAQQALLNRDVGDVFA